jgi:ribose transport system substrate-binding protein
MRRSALVVPVLAILVAACSGSATPVPATPAPATPAPATAAPATAAPATPAPATPAPATPAPTAEATPANKLIGVSNQGATYPFPGAIGEGIKSKGESLGYTVVQTDAGLKTDKQTTDINDLIAQKPAAIILNPVDGTQAMGLVDNIAAAGIPVFVVHGNVGAAGHPIADIYKGINLEITEDDVLAGKAAGGIAVKAFPNGAKYAIIEGAAGFVEVELRTKGFEEGLAAGTGFTKVASQPGDWVPDKGKIACQNMLQANPDIELFYAQSDDMGTGCYEAIKAAGSKAQVIGIGGAKLGIDAVAAGQLLGTVCYKPLTSGELIMQAVDDYLTGKKDYQGVFQPYDTPGITKDNLADCTPQW